MAPIAADAPEERPLWDDREDGDDEDGDTVFEGPVVGVAVSVMLLPVAVPKGT